jgi:hypothetical protein
MTPEIVVVASVPELVVTDSDLAAFSGQNPTAGCGGRTIAGCPTMGMGRC